MIGYEQEIDDSTGAVALRFRSFERAFINCGLLLNLCSEFGVWVISITTLVFMIGRENEFAWEYFEVRI